VKNASVEFIGTFFVAFVVAIAVGGGIAANLAPLAVFAILVACIHCGRHLSGAVYNPAVTVTLWMRGCQADVRIVFGNRRGAEERMALDLCKQKTLLLQPGWTVAATAPEAPSVSLGRVAGRLLIRNAAAFPVVELYIYQTATDAGAQPQNAARVPGVALPGPARLAGRAIGPGEERLLALPEGMGCRAGLTIILGDGAETQIPDIDFCAGEILVVN
jgi:hypothetical protein